MDIFFFIKASLWPWVKATGDRSIFRLRFITVVNNIQVNVGNTGEYVAYFLPVQPTDCVISTCTAFLLKFTKWNHTRLFKIDLHWNSNSLKTLWHTVAIGQPVCCFTLTVQSLNLCTLILYTLVNILSASCQLIGQKSNPIFWQLKYLVGGTVTLIQQVYSIEQCSDALFP